MALENDKIKDLFHSKLSDFEPDVPASVWSSIGLLLPQQPTVVPNAPDPSSSATSSSSSSASTAKTSIFKTIGITVGLAAAIIMGVLMIPDKQVEIENTAPVIMTEEKKEPEVSTEEVKEDTPTVPQRVIRKAPVAVSQVPATVLHQEQIEEKEEQQEEAPQIVSPKKATELPAPASIPDPQPQVKKKTMFVGVGGNFAMLAENSTYQTPNVLFSKNLRGADFNSFLNKENNNYYLQHNLPISFGLTVTKQLTPRWSLQTGLLYTHLSSEVTSSSVLNVKESQYFDYLGVPLYLNYTFLETGKTRFYVSVGGLIQKDIKGGYKSRIGLEKEIAANSTELLRIFYNEPYYVKKSLNQLYPQFSAHTIFGVYYPLYKNMGIYGAFGGAYYFDAGNQYRTIYSDRQFQLDMNLGVNFNF